MCRPLLRGLVLGWLAGLVGRASYEQFWAHALAVSRPPREGQ